MLAVLGTAQRQAGKPQARDTLLEAAAIAERLNATDVLVRAALGFIHHETNFGDTEAQRIARAALDRVEDDRTPIRARLLAALALAQDSAVEWEQAREFALDAIDTAERSGDAETFVHVVDVTRNPLSTPERLSQNIVDVQQAITLANRLGDPALRFSSRFHLTAMNYQEVDLASVDATLGEMDHLSEQIGLPNERWQLALLTTGRLLLDGRADDAEAANERALELGNASGSPDAIGAFGGLLYLIRRHQGRLDEIADFFVDIARENPSIPTLRAAVPLLLSEVGHTDDARRLLRAEAGSDFDFPYNALWLTGMSNFLDAAANTHERSAARILVDRVSPFATQVVSPNAVLVQGAIARPLARCATLLGDHDQAEEWFTIAQDIHARLRAPFWTALGQLDHAELCLARRVDRDAERARELAATAAATAAEHGCTGLTRRATGLTSL